MFKLFRMGQLKMTKMKWNFYIILSSYICLGRSVSLDKIPSTTHMDEERELDCPDGTFLSRSVCIPKTYLKGEVPAIPTLVNSRIEINNIREVNDKNMRITLEIYQESLWVDNRIKTSLAPNEVTVLNNNLIKLLWKPDLWIKNLFRFKLHAILEPTGGLVIMNKEFCKNEDFTLRAVREKASGMKNCSDEVDDSVKQNTLVMYNMEAQVELHCNFLFEKFPMDTQYCEFTMNSSYPYPDIVHLSFEQGQFGVTNRNLHTDDFMMEVIFQDNTNQTGVNMIIQLERCILPYIIRYYLPCMAIAIVSLINFCIPLECIAARVTLLVTQFLTLTNILISQQANSPSSGTFTALGLYMLASLFFVVIGLIQFSCVLHFHQCNSIGQRKKRKTREEDMNGDTLMPREDGSHPFYNATGPSQYNIRKIDRVAFYVTGLLFLIFNTLYWLYFMSFGTQ